MAAGKAGQPARRRAARRGAGALPDGRGRRAAARGRRRSSRRTGWARSSRASSSGQPTSTFFRALVAGVVEEQRRIDPIIHAALPPTWPLTRIDLTLRAILRCGVFELLSRRDVPARVVITEYVDVANAFFAADEPGLVNGVLDRVARDVRPEEFSKSRRPAESRRVLPDELSIIDRYFRPLAGEGAFGSSRRCRAARGAAGQRSRRHHRHDRPRTCISSPTPPDTIAQKALRVNLSDLAAKGARPLGYILSLALHARHR